MGRGYVMDKMRGVCKSGKTQGMSGGGVKEKKEGGGYVIGKKRGGVEE